MLIRTLFRSKINHNPAIVLYGTKRHASFHRVKKILSSIVGLDADRPPYTHVCQIGDPVLRKQALKVDPDVIQTSEFQGIVKNLINVMRKYHVCGISAPQVGLPIQLFAMEQTEDDLQYLPKEMKELHMMQPVPLTVVINPELHVTNYNLITKDEHCSSIHGFCANVPRYQEVRLEALDLKGQPFIMEAQGHQARIVQHEYDHLHGVLFTDKMHVNTLSLSFWNEVNRRKGKIMWSYRPTLKSRILTAMFR